MTQSGQGEEPSARPAREGIVLPSDGGEPLLPGMPGASGGGRPGGPAPAPPPTTTPAGGQAWGTPWGPDQQQNPPAAPGWTPPPAQPWGSPEGAPQQPASWGAPGQDAGAPLPQEGTPDAYGTAPRAHQDTGHDGTYGHHGAAPLPPAQHGGPDHALPPADGGTYGHHGAAPLPPAQHGGPDHTLPPADGGTYGHQGAGAPLPPAGDGATQYLPPAPGGHTDQATHYLPPVAASAPDEGATQYIPPVGPGALPPEMPAGARADSPAESTQFLGRAPQHGGPHAGHAGRPHHAGQQVHGGPMPPASGPDAEATQFIAPVSDRPSGAPGERQPPAEFDNLFRSEPGGAANATQQMPRFAQQGPPHAAAQTAYAPQGPGGGRHGTAYDGEGGRGGRGGRGGSRVPLIAAIGVAIVVVGVGAGALLAGGGGEQDDKKQPVSATAPVAEESPSPSADPAEAQAVELDKLLADSGDSRTSVINAVSDVKACRNLDAAAKDLRDAAKQRNELVTRLSGLSVDKLPDHAALTTALTKAWQASASADNHYAAWADQVAAKKGKCKKGQAFTSGQTAAGNRQSGIATQQKARAAELWNVIAENYGLTQRRPTQL
ncbi:hypothetical protein [Streptomyces sp. DH24]|uniref:hypothetical protein n=1 Tax=Streptomyces sp. DH24 TaxID=3040123 RepID=UPI0024414A79|nr:hypothetical protein [Streptomyces sp. DH24]MDG9719293.1 hypothetical protein [Streptomyces sp. DH24]